MLADIERHRINLITLKMRCPPLSVHFIWCSLSFRLFLRFNVVNVHLRYCTASHDLNKGSKNSWNPLLRLHFFSLDLHSLVVNHIPSSKQLFVKAREMRASRHECRPLAPAHIWPLHPAISASALSIRARHPASRAGCNHDEPSVQTVTSTSLTIQPPYPILRTSASLSSDSMHSFAHNSSAFPLCDTG